MTRSAWEIADEMTHAFDPETGEVDTGLWDALSLELSDKADAAHAVIVRLTADAAACSAEAQRLSKRAKAADARAARLRTYILDCLHIAGLDKLRTQTVTVARRVGAERVDVTDVDALPDSLVRLERKPLKREILDALKKGDDVRGATLARGPDSLTFR